METVEEVLQTVGKTIGVKDLTFGLLLRMAVMFLVGVLVIRVLMKTVDRLLARSQKVEAIRSYIHTAVNIFLWVLLVLMLAGTLDVDVTSIIAMLSVAGLAVSMALQNTLSNLAGGLVLLVTKPNSQLSATRITNFNRLGKRRMDLKFTASYDAPTAQVRAALQEALEAVPGIMDDPAPAIFLSEYQASSIEYLVRLWTLSGDYWDVYYALQEGVRDAFARHGVEMTYDHLNVHIVEK